MKVIKKSQNSRIQGFAYYFCLMIEGSVPMANGSGSRRSKYTDSDPGPQHCLKEIKEVFSQITSMEEPNGPVPINRYCRNGKTEFAEEKFFEPAAHIKKIPVLISYPSRFPKDSILFLGFATAAIPA